MISEPGFYDMPEDEYHADPCPKPSLSSSIAKMLVSIKDTPRHAWLQHPRLNPNHDAARAYNKAQAFGTVCHKLMLRKGGDVTIIEYDDFRGKIAQNERDEAVAAGKTPILAADYASAEQLVKAGRAQLQRHEDAADAFQTGKPEMTGIWREGDAWVRMRLDWQPTGGNVLYDYKTVSGSAAADQWVKQAFDLGSDIQAALYSRGWRALTGVEGDVHFRFVVQEMDPPYALNVIQFSGAAMALAEAKTAEAIRRWQWCMKHNAWPGHPKQICHVDAPIWHERAWEDVSLRREVADKDLMELANDWQAPLEAAE
jgi:hypothetical protein